MKKTLLSGVAALLLVTGAAHAADGDRHYICGDLNVSILRNNTLVSVDDPYPVITGFVTRNTGSQLVFFSPSRGTGGVFNFGDGKYSLDLQLGPRHYDCKSDD
jgi:hypothetical protein